MSNLLKRLEKVEELMNPPEAPTPPRIEIVLIKPDGTVSSRRMFGPGEPYGGRRFFRPGDPGADEENDED
jgi:hypothetical protein